MKVTRTSQLSDQEHTLDLDVTQEQLDRYATGKELLQDVFPDLSGPDREFIKSGITPEEWEEYFGSIEDLEEGEDPMTPEELEKPEPPQQGTLL